MTNDTVHVALVVSSSQKQQMLRQRLAEIDRLVLVDSFDNVRSAQQEMAKRQPDVVLIEVSLPRDDLLDLVRYWADDASSTHTMLLLGDAFAHDRVLQAVEAGALGYIHEDADSTALASAIRQVQHGQPSLPAELTYPLLQLAAVDLEITASERRERLSQLALILIPVGAALTALLGILEGEYWERLGIRPEDLGLNPADRLAMLITGVLLVAGFLGPLLFVRLWQESLCTWLRGKESESLGGNEDLHWYDAVYGVALKWLSGTRGRILISTVLLALAILAVYLSPLVLVVLIGPAVIAILVINVVGLEEYIPEELDLPRFQPGRVLVASAILVLSLTVILGYELLVVGPDLRPDGVHNVMAPLLLDIEAFPVMVMDKEGEAEQFGALLLGGARGVHVLYDPCHKEALWVPVVQVDLKAIDEVPCLDTLEPNVAE